MPRNPIFKGTRILVSDIIELPTSDLTIKEITRDYYSSLNKEMIKETLELAAKILKEEHYVKYTQIST